MVFPARLQIDSKLVVTTARKKAERQEARIVPFSALVARYQATLERQCKTSVKRLLERILICNRAEMLPILTSNMTVDFKSKTRPNGDKDRPFVGDHEDSSSDPRSPSGKYCHIQVLTKNQLALSIGWKYDTKAEHLERFWELDSIHGLRLCWKDTRSFIEIHFCSPYETRFQFERDRQISLSWGSLWWMHRSG